MREAKIIIPRHDNNDMPLPALLEMVVHRAVDQWGGATVNRVTGYWKNEERELFIDDNHLVTIAMDMTEADEYHLRQLAEFVADEATQECVYICHASGQVEFVNRVLAE